MMDSPLQIATNPDAVLDRRKLALHVLTDRIGHVVPNCSIGQFFWSIRIPIGFKTMKYGYRKIRVP